MVKHDEADGCGAAPKGNAKRCARLLMASQTLFPTLIYPTPSLIGLPSKGNHALFSVFKLS